MGASTEEATALRPNPLPLKSLIAENIYITRMKIWVQPHGLTIQIYFRRNQIHATEMHISMCPFGSETPIWRGAASALRRRQIDFRRGKLRHGNIFTHFGSSSRETAVSRDRYLKLSMAIFYTIRVSFPLWAGAYTPSWRVFELKQKSCKDHERWPHLTD